MIDAKLRWRQERYVPIDLELCGKPRMTASGDRTRSSNRIRITSGQAAYRATMAR